MLQVYALEANIGAGKTTLLSALQQAEQLDPCIGGPILMEPVERWMAPRPALAGGVSILQAFYDDPAGVGPSFQSVVMQTRLTQLIESKAHRRVVSERSIWSARSVFGDMVVSKAGPQRIAYDAWAEHADWAATHVAQASLAGIIYLRTSPAVCATRIALRNRVAEGDMSLDYLQRLHERHEVWVHSHPPGVRVLVLDGDRDIALTGSTNVEAIRAFITDAHE